MHSFLSHSVIVCVKWLPKEQTFHVELLHLPCCQVSVTCLIEAYLALKAVNIGSKKVYGISISNPAQHSLFSPGPVSKLRACSLPHPLSSASLLPACPSGRGKAATDQGRPAGRPSGAVLCPVAGNSTGQWGSECWEQKAGLLCALAGPCIMQVRNFSLLTDVNGVDPLALVLF